MYPNITTEYTQIQKYETQNTKDIKKYQEFTT